MAMSAIHNSGARFAEPACHPGTRVEILKDLAAWSRDTQPDGKILWVYGLAGMGKSAIAQMFAGECNRDGNLGASFFFQRGHPECGTWHRLFVTIAYQLAFSVPELFLSVQQAVEKDPLIVARMMRLQFERLIVGPLKQMAVTEHQKLPVLVLDGLDECEGHQMQQEILRLLTSAIHEHKLPIRILIASRPEPHIREVLEALAGEGAKTVSHFKVSADRSAYRDIALYLQEQFSKIHSEYLYRGIDLGAMWPSQDALNNLAKKSSGAFIYASTVVRFVGNQYSHPHTRLASVLNLDPKSTAPLDDLYAEILSAIPEEYQNLRILHAIWMSSDSLDFDCDPEEIDLLLALPRGTSRLMLRGMHSVFEIPSIKLRGGYRESITILHKSFADYLCDSRRAKRWCISAAQLQLDFLHSVIRLPSSQPLRDTARAFYK
ncbi:hypothetical protein GGX14DRAFT_372137 [Mycena pura]|uniref:Nephrocystin 3-like N-terminal domain-containing protein n=1 Tax=Mycena pura TaxID=153505 RepID=A0AAD6Y5L2_9AGAR|nr:hypothetical protein GGX14DRAFT_372137 [Mycena pura]